MDQKRKWIMGILLVFTIMGNLTLSVYPRIRVQAAGASQEVSEESKDESGESGGNQGGESLEESAEMYEVVYAHADGQNGYYRTKPSVEIRNMDDKAVTKYQLKSGDAELTSGTLEGVNQGAVILPEIFPEGTSTLEVWLESSEVVYQEVDGSRQQFTFRIDTIAPELSLSAPVGFDVWYTEDVIVTADAMDATMGSGLQSMRWFVNGNLIEEKNLTSFSPDEGGLQEQMITESSSNGKPIPIVVEVIDRAGNVTSMNRGLYIDRRAPTIGWSGATDYMISGQPVSISNTLQDENGLASKSVQIRFQDVDGVVSERECSDWQNRAEGNIVSMRLEQDGIYEITARASDYAGHETVQTMHLTVDQTCPVVRYVDQLNGTYLPYFEWNYDAKDMVSDFTSYEYHMKLDGFLYLPNERVTGEGMHLFQVEAVDAAGNKSEMQASFVVDHTAPNILFRNVEDGATYTESVGMIISTEDENDYIQKIEINGERQKISGTSQFYQFPMQESGDYTVTVTANDLAGNRVQRTIRFTVQEKATVVSKVISPVKNMLSAVGLGKQNEAKRVPIDGEENANVEDGFAWYQIAFMLAVVLVICGLGGLQIYENCKSLNKKKQQNHSEE